MPYNSKILMANPNPSSFIKEFLQRNEFENCSDSLEYQSYQRTLEDTGVYIFIEIFDDHEVYCRIQREDAPIVERTFNVFTKEDLNELRDFFNFRYRKWKRYYNLNVIDDALIPYLNSHGYSLVSDNTRITAIQEGKHARILLNIYPKLRRVKGTLIRKDDECIVRMETVKLSKWRLLTRKLEKNFS